MGLDLSMHGEEAYVHTGGMDTPIAHGHTGAALVAGFAPKPVTAK
jgi:hypothetical protein